MNAQRATNLSRAARVIRDKFAGLCDELKALMQPQGEQIKVLTAGKPHLNEAHKQTITHN